ncbi:chorismate-binding protein [Blattabacterium cuenoti]|uniref:chorismate-binding protein n=1 Tax=Blattabacterium cuenoti TaxID=1653831 RepID=UPI00163C88F3|nr:chorismate-binding protein [Blattabacterium cuenoti]
MIKKISIFSLYKKIIKNYWIRNNFVIFRKPYEKKIFFYSHYPNNGKEFFLIQDFDHNYTIKIKPKHIYFVDIQKLENRYNDYSSSYYERNSSLLILSSAYKNIIKKAIENIKQGFFQKVVLSRSIKISFHIIDLKKTFQKLVCSYPNTFISLWYNVDHGFWIGSSPELLMKCHKKKFKTSVLAGTIWGNHQWTKKEIKEHQIVVKYISQLLLQSYKGHIYLEKTKIIRVGHLTHLETPIFFSFFEKPNYYELLNYMHPTPSICGFPKKESLSFINKNEGYERKFYAGYLGTVNEKNMELYLNLRCAKVKENEITLYAGSGITINSNINQEYVETENKIKNILSQLFFK